MHTTTCSYNAAFLMLKQAVYIVTTSLKSMVVIIRTAYLTVETLHDVYRLFYVLHNIRAINSINWLVLIKR